MTQKLSHISILLEEILSFLPPIASGNLLDVTAGGGGHFFAMLKVRENWRGECWDRDPLAPARIEARASAESVGDRWSFKAKTFGEAPPESESFDFILADLGISSFQIDDRTRGMSLFSEAPVDFRMNPNQGADFSSWLKTQSVFDLERIFEVYGEEPKAKKLAQFVAGLSGVSTISAKDLAEQFRRVLSYGPDSRAHPATRAFQALRIAINDELGELESLLKWAPKRLKIGGRLAVMSFHSLEDRRVKKSYLDLAESGLFDILTAKPLIPSVREQEGNPRSRSAKLRVLEKRG